MPQRLASIDALRGIALLLMVEQHLSTWLWDIPWKLGDLPFLEHPFIISFNALGIAAPLFISLAGTGAWFFLQHPERSSRTIMLRGVILIGLGFLLNLLTPNHFSPGSWYVLHTIGLGLIISPLLKKAPAWTMLLLIVGVVLAAVFMQSLYDTPGILSNRRLGRVDLAGGFLRVMLAEGHYPVLPWLGFFMAGMTAGKWIKVQNWKALFYSSQAALLIAVLLAAGSLSGLNDASWQPLARTFTLAFHFFPALPPMVFLLLSLAVFLILLFSYRESVKQKQFPKALVCLGRTSLTIFFLHFLIFKELVYRLDIYQSLSKGVSVLIVFSVLILFALLALLWQKAGYRFGLEWVMKKAAP